jgi:hypothetical protein
MSRRAGKATFHFSWRLCWRLGEGIAAAAALAIVILVITLSQGPIPLAFAVDAMSAALNTTLTGVKADVESCDLVWDRNRRNIGIEVHNIRFTNMATGRLVAQFASAEASLSARGLLHGVLAPSRIAFDRPEITIIRRDDSQFAWTPTAQLDEVNPDSGNGFDLSDVREAVSNANDTKTMVGFLKTIAVNDAQIQLLTPGGHIVKKGRLSFALTRTPAGMALDAQTSLDQGAEDKPMALQLSAILNNPAGPSDQPTMSAKFHVHDFIPGRAADLHPDLAALKGIALPLSGDLTLEADLNGIIRTLSGSLTTAGGQASVDNVFASLVPVTSAGLSVHALDLPLAFQDIKKFQIERMALETGDAHITGSGLVQLNPVAPGLDLELTGKGLKLGDVLAWWPPSAAAGGRNWVVRNMDRGEFPNLKVKVQIPAGLPADAPLASDAVKLDFDFQGLRTRFLGELPPLDTASGNAHLSATGFDVWVKSAKVGALDATDGHVEIKGLDRPVSNAVIDVVLTGSMAETLRILDYAPLGYPKKFGIVAASVGGRQRSKITVKLPLLETVSMAQVSIKLDGKTQGLSLPKLVAGKDLTGADLTLTLDNNGLDASGFGRVEGVPLNIGWTENFEPGPKQPSSRYQVSGILDDADRNRLGLSTDWRARGPIGARAEFTGRGGQVTNGKVELNLDSTLIDYPELDLLRLPDGAGNASFDVAFPPERIVLSNIKLKAGELSLQGNVAFDLNGHIAGLALDHVKVGTRSDVDVSMTRRTDRLTYDIIARKFDATGLLDELAEEGDPAAPPPAGPPYNISVRALSVRIADDAPMLRNLSLSGDHDGRRLMRLSAQADVGPGTGRLDLSISPKSAGKRRLSLHSTDAGAALSAAGIFDEGAGGALSVEGEYDDTQPDSPLSGSMEIKDIRIGKAPVLFQLLTLASLDGALDTLQGTGIMFGESKLTFHSRHRKIALNDGLFSGPMLALTLSGIVDQQAETLDLKGALVPLSRLNSLLGGLPLIGDLIVGRKDEGIIGLDYSITGPSSQPVPSVNPLSVLAPSFLKRIFDIGTKKPSAETPEK